MSVFGLCGVLRAVRFVRALFVRSACPLFGGAPWSLILLRFNVVDDTERKERVSPGSSNVCRESSACVVLAVRESSSACVDGDAWSVVSVASGAIGRCSGLS